MEVFLADVEFEKSVALTVQDNNSHRIPVTPLKDHILNAIRNVVGARKNFAKCNGVLRFSEADMSRVADGELIHYVQGVIRTWVNNPR